MNSGKTNIKFGFLWITLATFLGFILAIKMQTGGEEWQKSPIKGYWSVAHVHANTLAILNILYGLFIGRVGLGDSARKLGSASRSFPCSFYTTYWLLNPSWRMVYYNLYGNDGSRCI